MTASREGTIGAVRQDLDVDRAGREMYELAAELFPICRSITGDGFRQTLDILERTLPLERSEVSTGTRVFDWTVPREWNVRDAWVKAPDGRKIIDFKRHNLHLLNYSVPFRGRVSREVLSEHLHSLPEQPDWIPYRTSYYEEQWGFCVAHNLKSTLPDGEYEVCVDTTLEAGSLTYGEHVVRGATDREVLLSCHGCHPSLANDNLSGLVIGTRLARLLAGVRTRYTYRLVIVPGTIGAIAWLARNEPAVDRIDHGLVLACLGDRGGMTYKKSRRGDALIDRAVQVVLRSSGGESRILDFDPYGYDERQYCSPGFDLPVGRLTRTPHGEYPEYHTSADNLELIDPQSLAHSLTTILDVFEVLESDASYVNTSPKCEPQLGRRGIYGKLGGVADPGPLSRAVFWVLNLSDGSRTLLDICERSAVPFGTVRAAAELLESTGLLRANPQE
jgi:aminopeptidase-like protein